MKKAMPIIGVLLVLVLQFSACSTSHSAEEPIESVIQFIFTAPNAKIAENEVLKTATTVEAITEELKALFPDIAEMCTDTAMESIAIPMGGVHITAAAEDITVSVKSTEVEVRSEESRTYTFTCVLVVEGEEKREIEVSGMMQLAEDGRITYVDDDEAVYAIYESMNELA